MAALLATLICVLSLFSATIDTQARRNVKVVNLEERESKPVGDLLDSVLPQDCGRRFLNRSRLSGGYTARLGEFPSYVRLDVQLKGQTQAHPACGGILISDRHVLTAAHCFERHKTVAVNVSTTIYFLQPSPVYPVDRICVSPKFNTSIDNFLSYDMAVLRLGRPIKFDRNIQPACLPKRPSKGKKKLRAVGLGMIWENPANISEVWYPERLQALPVKWKNCEDPLDSHVTKFCVDTEDPRFVGNVCQGDSGGPIYGLEDGRMVVVGVVSYGSGGCKRGVVVPSVHTDVYGARDLLVELMTKCQ